MGAERNAMDAFEAMEKIVTDAKADYLKWKGGNKAAGVRVRKAMQDIKEAAQAVRVAVLDTREADQKS
jgi:hypothetical protein